MKYWRGYLAAILFALFAWGLTMFAKEHTPIIDMVYPYVSRMVQSFLAQWSSGTAQCLWQLALVVLIVGAIASIVLMILLRWNPIQWFGWILSIASLVFLLQTALYGMNYYASPLSEDIRLKMTPYTVGELEAATIYYRDQANALSQEVRRDAAGELQFSSFSELALQAEDGFHALTYDKLMPVFAGSTVPVKELGFADLYTAMGIDGVTIAITGEAAVNPQIPAIALPFTMCHEMSHRMSIAVERDANMGGFLACTANSSQEFQYSGYFMAYRYCYEALASVDKQAAAGVAAGETAEMKRDLQSYRTFYHENQDPKAASLANAANDAYLTASGDASGTASYGEVCDLLVNWHIQTVILPTQTVEPEKFDPLDKNQVDVTDLIREW